MLKLIVNADDFGKSNKVNESIRIGFKHGIIRAASLMANGNAFEEAVEIINENPELDVGIHFTLTQGKSILNSDQIKSLINPITNCFYNNSLEFSKRYYLNKLSFSEIKNEFTAQYQKILDQGVRISHIDSHQHIHLLPKIFDTVIELAKKLNVRYVRIPDEKIKGYMILNRNLISRIPAMITLKALSLINKRKVSTRIETFTGFYFGGTLNEENLTKLIYQLPQTGTCELMCHPGFEPAGENKSSLYIKTEENEALIDKDVKSLLTDKNIEIVSFRKLVEGH